MKKTNILLIAFLMSYLGSFAQTSCSDWNEYVAYKNINGTGFYTLEGGVKEKSAQTYHYSGPGNITDISINGKIPSGLGWSPSAVLNVKIYNVDANNRPTSVITERQLTWLYWESNRTIAFGSGGVPVNDDFAVSVELSPLFNGQQFQVEYTGDGEGDGQNLPSASGTSTGGNWISLMPTNDGDLYIIPRVNHFISSDFDASATCNVNVNQTVAFTDQSLFTKDPMFNTITLSGYSGTSTLYSWNFGDGGTSTLQNPSHSFATAGVYTVSLTTTLDSWPMGGSVCSDVKTMKISVGLNVVSAHTNLLCNDDESGTITLTASGGDNSAYLYSINGTTWQVSPVFADLGAGTYTIYVKDGNMCVKAGSPVTITQPSPISINNVSFTLSTCGNDDGALLFTASGGTGTLEFSLDDLNYQANGAFNNLFADSYTIFVEDANGCKMSKNVALNSTTSPTIVIQSYTNVSCNGDDDGSISVIGSGGTGALQYSIDGVNFQTSGNFTSVSAGSFVPTVKDAAGCIGSLNCMVSCDINITEPELIKFSLSQTPTLCNGSNNGIINVNGVIGGTGTITYSLNGVNFQSMPVFTGLSAGNYTVTLKDITSCMSTANITVTGPNAIVATVASTFNLSCNESTDGQISVSAVGGSGSYTYALNGGIYYPSGSFYSLEAGVYNISVRDGNGCLGSTTATLTQPSEIMAAITTGNSTCGNSNGTLLAIPSGGSGAGYTYSIDGGITSNGTGAFSGLLAGSYLVLITDGSGCEKVVSGIITDSDGPVIASASSTNVTCHDGENGTITVTSVTGGTGTIMYSVDGGQYQISNVLTGLSAGNHIVVIKDDNGCTGEITENITEPSAFSIVLNHTDLTCYAQNNGSILVNAAGGSGTLAYSIDGSNFQSSTAFEDLYAGTYIITVRDAGQCTATSTITITQPSEINIYFGFLNVSCADGNNGSINAIAFGGTGALEYSLNCVNYFANGNFNNLASGTYTLCTRDASNCMVSTNISILEPTPLVLSSSVSDVSCAGGDDGVINITVIGGVMPYSYDWSNLHSSEDIFNLEPGTYSVVVTDGNGCNIANIYTVTEPSNPIIINGTILNSTSSTSANGSVDITVTGGTAPYTYSWGNGATTQDISSLLPGVYVVEITDANGCSTSSLFIVSVSLGIDEASIDEVTLFPNPSSNMISIESPLGKPMDRIEFIDIAGKMVMELNPNNTSTQIEVNSWAEGLYFVNVYTGTSVITKKLVIKK